jgi:hypothetical protein
VNGASFAPGATVRWNGAALNTTFVSGSQLAAAVPAANIAAPGTASVTVVNPGTGVVSNVVFFPVGAPSPNVFYNFAPQSPLMYAYAPLGIGEFTGDGRTDILAWVSTPSILVLLNNGDGTFTPGPSTALPAGSSAVGIGDFNGDGRLDVLAVDQKGTVTVLLGNGDGTFTLGPSTALGPGVGQFVFAVDIADFNGDGKLDFLGQEGNGGPIQVFWGNGDGTFTPGPSTALPPGVVGQGRFNLLDGGLGDFNGDGKPDLVITDGYYVWVMLGNGDGTFKPAPGSPMNLGVVGDNVVVADFNGDGKLDIAVPNYGDSDRPTVAILLGNGDGTFAPVPGCCGTPEPQINSVYVLAGDFNDDGKLDLAVGIENMQSPSSGPAGYIETFLGNGDGTFTPTDYSVILPSFPATVYAADFNGDGKLDFATRDYMYGGVSVLLQGPPSSPAPDFTITASSPTLSVTAGGTVTDNIQIASVGGYLAALGPLTCSGAPYDATCTVTQPPGEIIPTATGSFPLTVTTLGPPTTPAGGPAFPPLNRWPFIIWFGLLVTGAALSVWRRKPGKGRSPTERGLALLATLILGLALCGSCGGTTPLPPGGTPPGTYTLTVTLTSGSLTHATTIALTVH